jgi:hypothetical protein
MPARPPGRFGIQWLPALIGAAGLAACGAHGFGCGDFGVGPCGPPVQFEVAIDVTVADLNGDGRPDVALPVSKGAGTPGVVAVFEHVAGPGKGYRPRADSGDGISSADRIISADLDGDGRPDLIVASAEGTGSSVAVLLNNAGSPGTLRLAQTLSVPYPNDLAAADLSGNGRPALLFAGDTLSVALQNPGAPGTFAAPTTLYTGDGGAFVSVAVGDLDGDGMPDIAVADETGVTVLFLTPGAATPTVARAVRVYSNPAPPPNTGQTAVAIADLDGDGRNDLVVIDPVSSVVAVLLQSHSVAGEFLPAALYSLPPNNGLNRLAIADLNADRLPDLVIAAGDAVLVYLQNAAQPGTFLPVSSYPAVFGFNGVAVADVDGDGLPDIVTDSGATIAGIGALPPPGVLYQDPGNPGHFLPVQDLQIMSGAQ